MINLIMGMFDNLKCEYPLPDGAPTVFQTKDTPAQFLEDYTVTKDGRLIHHSVRYEDVPDEEMPMYGTPEWDTHPLARFRGSLRSVPDGDKEIDYTGSINIYALDEARQWWDITLLFQDGKVIGMSHKVTDA